MGWCDSNGPGRTRSRNRHLHFLMATFRFQSLSDEIWMSLFRGPIPNVRKGLGRATSHPQAGPRARRYAAHGQTHLPPYGPVWPTARCLQGTVIVLARWSTWLLVSSELPQQA